jgi:hypothetical protein
MEAEGIVVPSLRTVLAARRAAPVRKGAAR